MKPFGLPAAMAEEQLSPGTAAGERAGSSLAEPVAEPLSSGVDSAVDAKSTGIGLEGKSSHGLGMKALYASSL
eukprot:COSAG04_NODE_14030_length_583_cov_1.066116_1_plen_72_part_01